jgi:hypothetical protein
VIEKNKVIATGDLPSPVIVKHGNGRDWWLIVGDMISQNYFIYLIDSKWNSFKTRTKYRPGFTH